MPRARPKEPQSIALPGDGTRQHPWGSADTAHRSPEKPPEWSSLHQEGALTIFYFPANSTCIFMTSEIIFFEATLRLLFVYAKGQKNPRPAPASHLHPGYEEDKPESAELPCIPANGMAIEDDRGPATRTTPAILYPRLFYKTHARFLEKALKHQQRQGSSEHPAVSTSRKTGINCRIKASIKHPGQEKE